MESAFDLGILQTVDDDDEDGTASTTLWQDSSDEEDTRVPKREVWRVVVNKSNKKREKKKKKRAEAAGVSRVNISSSSGSGTSTGTHPIPHGAGGTVDVSRVRENVMNGTRARAQYRDDDEDVEAVVMPPSLRCW